MRSNMDEAPRDGSGSRIDISLNDHWYPIVAGLVMAKRDVVIPGFDMP